MPDILILGKGSCIFCEVKLYLDKLSYEQVIFQQYAAALMQRNHFNTTFYFIVNENNYNEIFDSIISANKTQLANYAKEHFEEYLK